jgi:hypothetical protein
VTIIIVCTVLTYFVRNIFQLHCRRKIPDRERDIHDNLTYFKVPQSGIDSIRSKLVFKIFDEYANILKGMYSTRFNGRPKNEGDHDQMDTAPGGPSPPLITSLQVWYPNNTRRHNITLSPWGGRCGGLFIAYENRKC